MRRASFIGRMLLLLAMVISPTGLVAATYNVPGDTGDYELNESLTLGNKTGTAMRVGATSATTPGGRNGIYIFELPVISATNQVTSATLDFYLATKSGSPSFNADLWGAGFIPGNEFVTGIFGEVDTDTNSANIKLHNNVLTSASPLGSLTSSNFAGYLNRFYTNNGGYAGGVYVFLRVNPDANAGQSIVGYNISSADSTNPPLLNLTTAYIFTPPAPTNLTAVAANGQVSLTWPAVSGVTNYHVKKCRFSSGPYALIATVTGTNYIDAGLVNGEACHYVVAGVSTNGEGFYSREAAAIPFAPMTFAHPGLLHSQADLDRMKQKIAAGIEPWFSGFVKFTNDAYSKSTYTIAWQSSYKTIGRNPNVNISPVDADASAAYQLALMWCLTSNSAYATKAIQILNNWSSSLTNISGSDAILLAGIDGAKFLNAAELLRHSNSGWTTSGINQFTAMMTNLFLPVIANFATFANGNWDIACEKTMIAMGVFCDRPDLYACATNYFYTGPGCGSLPNYIYPNGQAQESGRDQTHTQLGLGQLTEICEVAWQQGADLYGSLSNRLLAGYEYTAKFNQGYEVPFTPANFNGWSNGIYFSGTISEDTRGIIRPIYEIAYNHYANRRGLTAPFTAWMATNVMAPEGQWSGTDHPGFGTLTCSLAGRTNWPTRLQAEAYSGNSGITLETCSEGGQDVTSISSNDYVRFASVNQTNVQSFTARIANGTANRAAIRIVMNDATTGPVLGICEVPVTHGWQDWVTVSCNLKPTNVLVANLFLVFSGNPTGTLFNLNWFCLNTNKVSPQLVGNITTFLTGAQTVVDLGAPDGLNWFGGEQVGNSAPATFPVGTNFVTWYSTNASGYISTQTQTVVVAGPPMLSQTVVGSQLQLNWPTQYLGWRLERQSNVSDGGLAGGWVTVAGSTSTNQINGLIDGATHSVFFRLTYP